MCKSKKQPISVTHSSLLLEWDYRKNQLLGLEPVKITHGSGKKVWWICEKGHSWKASVNGRASKVRPRGCKYCSNQAVGYGNDLLTNHPGLCEEWDYDKNKLGPENYMPGSGKKVWWICEKGHGWPAEVYSRVNGRGCPYCSNKKAGYGNDLLTNHPELCEEWDYEKNKLGPENYFPGSNKRAWWKCSKGHFWEAAVASRVGGHGCPYCSNQKRGYGNDLLTNHPELCGEWDYQKNKLGPDKYAPGSKKKVWWKCSQGHSWCAQIKNRTRGQGCPFCSNKRVGYGNDLLTNYPELCEEWDFDKNELGPDKHLPGSHKKVWWICEKGHSWCAFVYSRTKPTKPSGCPRCFGESSVSTVSQKWLDSLDVEQREVQIGPFRVDGFDPETNTVYEFFGDFWHGNPKVFSAGKINPSVNKTFGQLYHETKTRILRLQTIGYKVVYIWENDFTK